MSDWYTEHPRPQFRRESFFSLNGPWDVNGQTVQLPFPPQSRLSGWQGDVPNTLTYTRSFRLPAGFHQPGWRILLHLDAVDQVADVQLNGRTVARHEGGYLPFSADITDSLRPGANELSIRAVDTLSYDYPRGKQSSKRGGMWYTPVSGVWQSVWLECVPPCPIERITIIPDLTGVTLTVECREKNCAVEIPGVLERTIETNRPVRLNIPDPHLWTPDDPYLYPLILTTDADRVESYFALRTVSIGHAGSHPRILLNNQPIFLNGVLDQGYFEDGLFLPSDPSGYEADVLRMKELGINLIRKHIKIEPAAFYHACDRLGMLVMQDMVSGGGYSFLWDTALPTVGFTYRPDRCAHPEKDAFRSFFTRHCLDTVSHLKNYPSIISWCIFNEGWGQFNADEHYELIRHADPTRLIDSTSGWFRQKKSDFDSRHVYFRNKHLKGTSLPLFLSECGGYSRPIEGHMFNPDAQYGYGAADSESALTEKIETMWNEMVLPSIRDGLCGLVYTQISDVEDEINGLYTYDREICKVDKDRLRALAAKAQDLLNSDQ